jgi:hypothetical protein
LAKLAHLQVSAKQVERICKRIGGERCAERDEAVAAYLALPLVERKAAPAGVTPPAVAVASTDGGRLKILDEAALTARGRKIATGLGRKATAPAAAAGLAPQTAAPSGAAAGASPAEPPAGAAPAPEMPAPTAAAPATAAAGDTGTVATVPGEEKSRFWREDKIGLLLAMTSEPAANDPCPEIPETFVDPLRMRQLVRELHKGVPVTEEVAGPAANPAGEACAPAAQVWQPPQVQEKRLLSSRRNWDSFGPMVATAAYAMGLFAAARRAFLGDGAENNWTVWRSFFSSFEPILDFIHALSYVYAAAHAGRGKIEGWKCYVEWIRWVWQGQVVQVLLALEARQAELGVAEVTDAEGKPRKVVAEALTYLTNNQERMHYDSYRRQGLPIMSSYVESAVKQFNQRVKGTEKFWSEEGAEAILQLRGDHLSDDQPLAAFWQRRQAQATGRRRYRRVA